MKKLSAAQQRVVDLMEEGWALCSGGVISARHWLQRDGCGCGGPVEKVNGNTFYALVVREIIKRKKFGYPTTSWRLK